MWSIINSFSQIYLSSKTLIICDIDDTLLYFPNIHPFSYDNLMKYYISLNNDETKAHEMTINYINWLYKISTPFHTDMYGFYDILNRLNNFPQSNICFLTARSGNYENREFTKNNFTSIGLDYYKFDVHYSSNIPKGEYIKNNINISNYDNIIFIDDKEFNIQNVNLYFGSRIKCYKFEHGKFAFYTP
jgi:hypothetical protein